jgi:hypothetical protein
MDINDALNMLNENKGGHLYNVYIPSHKKEYSFKQMTVAQHKTMAKMAIEDSDGFAKFLLALIMDLYQGEEEINFNNITEIDKNYILYAIKVNNSNAPLTLSLKCGNCGEKFEHSPKVEDVLNRDVNIENTFLEGKHNGHYVKIEIGLPSVQENLIYGEFCKNIDKDLKTEDEKRKRAYFIASYEMFLMCIKRVFINEDEISGFDQLSIEKKLKLIDSLSIECLDVKDIQDYLKSQYDKISYKINCTHCEHEFEDMMQADNFFF